MANLYELTDYYNKALTELLEIDGLDNDVFADTMSSIEGELLDKGKNVAAYFQNLDADIDAMKAAESRIKARRVIIESKSARLKEYLRFNMEQAGITKIECSEFSVSLRKGVDSVEVMDESLIPTQFINEKITRTPDKNSIKAAIKKGEEVEGARLVKGKSSLIIK